jgi:predicted transposase YbfD/YdcC
MDALRTQRQMAQQMVDAGGEYGMVVKENQKKTGEVREDVVAGVTSLAPERADAARLLTLIRGQWQSEHPSHGVRDMPFDEDRSQVRGGHMPQVMAALRNTVIGLMCWAGYTNIAAACRRFAAQPTADLQLIGIALEN